MELWTDARVPVAFSASPTGEAPPALPVRGQEQRGATQWDLRSRGVMWI